MAIICTLTHDLQDFDWDKRNRVLSAEASTIERGRRTALMAQVYDDACDEGFVIESHHTDRRVVFALDKIDRDNDGDIAGWWFKPAERKDAALNIKVLIIND